MNDKASKPIVVVGSINMDLVVKAGHIPLPGETIFGSHFQTFPGGKGANQAVAVGRLGHPVSMIGRLGADGFGEQLRRSLEDAGVNTQAVTTTPGSSGVALIVVAASGENSIVVVSGANTLVTPEDLDVQIEMIRGAGMVLAQLEIPMETIEHLAVICEREGVPLMLDPAPAAALSPQLLRRVGWMTPNETEAAFYAKSLGASAGEDSSNLMRTLLDAGPQGVVLKLGGNGVQVGDHSGFDQHVAAFPVKAIDTTGAGDCFNGAFAVGLMNGMSTLESARFAAAAAGVSVTRSGAQSSMPNLADTEALLHSTPRPTNSKG